MNDIIEAAAAVDPTELAAALIQEHVADIVERLNAEPLERASAVLSAMPLERAAEVLDEPGLEAAADLVEAQPPERAVRLLKALSSDQRADIFRHLGAPARERLLSQLDLETRASLAQLLAYPENTAGSIMTTEFVGVPSSWSVGETLSYIRKIESTRETIYAIYLLDPKTKTLVKTISLRRLIASDPDASVLSIALPRRPVTVSPYADREEVARLISKYDLLAVPVVDQSGHVLGIVTVDDIIDAIVEETHRGRAEIRRHGGARRTLHGHRLLGDDPKAGGMAVCVIFKRDAYRQRDAALCRTSFRRQSFLPCYSTHYEFGRQLRLAGDFANHSSYRTPPNQAARLVAGSPSRVTYGITLGAILGLLGILRITVWQKLGIFDYGEHWVLVACTVGTALVGIVTFGSLVGSMLPFISETDWLRPGKRICALRRYLVDVSGLVIYFSIALVFLRGTLL